MIDGDSADFGSMKTLQKREPIASLIRVSSARHQRLIATTAGTTSAQPPLMHKIVYPVCSPGDCGAFVIEAQNVHRVKTSALRRCPQNSKEDEAWPTPKQRAGTQGPLVHARA
jgi:hypothetical protein